VRGKHYCFVYWILNRSKSFSFITILSH